jgi:pyruvate/2-oxoglutarate dehydrogenase complex dihydrolipoamide dehydrogenase (E3) component
MITGKNILEMTSTPNSMIFIGVHAIAMELSHVLQRVDYSLTALEAMALLLPSMDVSGIGEIKRIRIKILENVDAKSVANSGNAQSVSFATPVANSAARCLIPTALTWKRETSPNDGLQFEIDENLRNVSNPIVYFASDARATITGRHLWGPTSRRQHRLWRQQNSRMPTAVCVVPAVVMVSLTEAEADYEAKANDLSGWMSSRTYA